VFLFTFCIYFSRGGSRGGHPARAFPPPLKLEKIWFFGVKSWFFTRKTPKIFAPSTARRNFFKCAASSLKLWIRPCFSIVCLKSTLCIVKCKEDNFVFLQDLVEALEYRCYIMLGKRFIKWLAMLFHYHSHSLFISLIEVVITIRISYNRWVLTNNLLHQRFLMDKLMVSLRRFYDCHNYLVNHYGMAASVSWMTKDIWLLTKTLKSSLLFILLLEAPSALTNILAYSLQSMLFFVVFVCLKPFFFFLSFFLSRCFEYVISPYFSLYLLYY
jgi:hypothetical protein